MAKPLGNSGPGADWCQDCLLLSSLADSGPGDDFRSQPSSQQRVSRVVLIQKVLKRKERKGLPGASTNLEGLLAKLYV